MSASIDSSKCVLVTGATSGIGRALALEISKLPSSPKVIGTGRRKDRLEELAKAEITPVSLDVSSDFESLRKTLEDIIQKHPDLDTVILNAGIQNELDVKKDFNLDKISQEIYINYTSVVAFIKFLLPHFLKLSEQGRPSFIIPVTSGLAITPGSWVSNYSASKGALHNFALALRAQLSDTQVHVLEIMPPLVESELHDAYGTTDKFSRFWMPLDQYVKTTLEGLRRGDSHILAGTTLGTFEKFEKGKEEAVLKLAGVIASHK